MKALITKANVLSKFVVVAGILTASLVSHAAGNEWVQDLTKDSLTQTQDGSPDVTDVLDTAYSTSTLLTKALEESRELPLGERIKFFRESVASILKKSGKDPLEEPVRLTLTRARDMMDSAIKIAGENPELIAQWSANFYKTAFELAVGFANNPTVILTKDSSAETANYLKKTSIAQFGYYFSTMLWRYQANLTSDSSKAYILVRMLGYLGQDFNNDLRRRENNFKEILADIYKIQSRDVAYSKIIHSFSLEEAPQSPDVAALRVKVYRVWSGIPAKLSATGLPTLGTAK
ncbi:MAG TPA: hypothetical protein VN132_06530 [Bdellovibrio sp.]|nr:hypothetical protein [Bdellovibrio sp.]